METTTGVLTANNNSSNNADQVTIVYYTDPLCCWSWALEPQWRLLRYEFCAGITWRYCMGGLIPSWKSFNDGVNAVTRPAQMGPVWMEASHLSGMPIQSHIWANKDYPASSYLSCIAVKCAEQQSLAAGEKYLRMLREAVMLKGKNISVLSVLIQVAENLASIEPILFNAEKFIEDMKNERGLELLRLDLQEVQRYGINRFPTILFKRVNHPSLIISGYRPYTALLTVMKQIAPDIQRVAAIDATAYSNYWGSILQRELKETVENKDVLI